MSPEAIEIRTFAPANAEAVSRLIHRVFDEHVAPTFEPDGIAEMYEFTSAEAITERAREQGTFVAWQGGQVVGVIQMRQIDHLALLFVRSSHMGLGVATALMARVEGACRAVGRPNLTVNSSLNARTFYEHLGFAATSEPQRAHGFAYVPMEKTI